ncbi:ABC transporter permease [Streptomyces flavalbus]|uniref:FtsX-like permease family protein n=1 Tax=Streptomyces flavalbus TaxID=2665155 RepID=A0ABW2WBE1_9ACTN
MSAFSGRPFGGGGGGALRRVVRSGVNRRRVQTVVIAVATMMAVAATVVAGALLVATNAPFDRAFAEQNGAHLTAQYDPAKVSADRLAATGRLDGVTASAGPYPYTTISPVDAGGGHLPQLSLVGRSGPHGDVDDLDLRSGRWARQPGEIVLDTSFEGPALAIGSELRTSDTADSPTLTIVGFAMSASRTADAWTTPAQVEALSSRDRPVTHQMLYRFTAADTKDQLAADRATLAAAVPSGALLGTQSYLDTKRAADQGAAATIPFMVAFGVLGIVMSVIIISSVISGAVGTSLRRIGVLKAIGFTPREVVRAYVAQALIPAALGIALGVVLGNLLAAPLLSMTAQAYGGVTLSVTWWVDLVVPAVALLVVGVAALVPALRAGRLRTVEAIAVGRAPRTGRGQWAHRALGRLPLPRAVTYGLASPFAHPVRTAAMLLAVAFGTVAATFALGLTQSLNAIGRAADPEESAAVTAINGAPAAPDATAQSANSAEIRAAIAAQPGTASYYGMTHADVTVAGLSTPVRATLFQGDTSSGRYEMIAGHWFTGAGQAVVPTGLLERTGTSIGDPIRVTLGKDTRTLRIVGEAFDTSNDGLTVHTDLASFPGTTPEVFQIDVEPNVSPAAYAERLNTVVRPLGGDVIANSASRQENTIILLDAIAVLLTLMLLSVAGLGVLNSVVLDTRERVHDLGVCKALGMTPRQTVSLVLASVTGIGLLGGLIGVPAGYALHGLVLPLMGHSAGTNLPPSILDVYDTPQLALLGAAGITIAVLGALLPASWASKTRTATALRTE